MTPPESPRVPGERKFPARTLTDKERRETVSYLSNVMDAHEAASKDTYRGDARWREGQAEVADYYRTALACTVAVLGGPITIDGWVEGQTWKVDFDAIRAEERAAFRSRLVETVAKLRKPDDMYPEGATVNQWDEYRHRQTFNAALDALVAAMGEEGAT